MKNIILYLSFLIGPIAAAGELKIIAYAEDLTSQDSKVVSETAKLALEIAGCKSVSVTSAEYNGRTERFLVTATSENCSNLEWDLGKPLIESTDGDVSSGTFEVLSICPESFVAKVIDETAGLKFKDSTWTLEQAICIQK